MEPFTPQPAWISASTAEMELRARAFIRSVYGWMAFGLLLTALGATWVVFSPAMQALVLANPFVFIGLLVVEIGTVVFLQYRLMALTPAAAASAFLIYSFLNGLTLSGIFWRYSHQSIVLAFVTAAGMFGAMSIYGLVTKKDLTSWGAFFGMGLIGILLCMVVNFFLRSSGLSFVISIVGVFVFIGLTAYDNQKLKSMATVTGPKQENVAVIGALALYLDFINMFLFLLQLFGGNRRR
jgi:FtsH-binding integral membrane protein